MADFGLATAFLLIWMQVCAAHYGVEPEFAWAVARVESGTKTQEIRLGRLGKTPYAGPFGLHVAYVREKHGLDATDPLVNVMVGVRALQGRDKLKVLRRYNRASTRAYEQAVLAIYRQAKRDRIFKGGHHAARDVQR